MTDVEVAGVPAQLELVLASPGFARSPRMTALLRYLVERTLAGEGAYLKEYTIALDVFEREDDFDPQTNPVVRVQASKLRRMLSLYFLEEGRGDPIEIALPRGSYVPSWRPRVDGAEAADVAASAHAETPTERDAQETFATPSVAVLPFTVVGRRERMAEHEAFVEGLCEEVTSLLSRHGGVDVAARQSHGNQSNGKPIDIRTFGAALGVRFVLEGSVRVAGPTTRVTASLVDVGRGVHLWSDRFDTALAQTNVLELQDELARSIVLGACEALGAKTSADGSNVATSPAGPERRQLTVMQCQLVDAGQIATKLDPEEALGAVQAFQHTVTHAVARYGGHVARQSDEQMWVYFGYPHAHEDDAERALRAALDTLRHLSSVDPPLGRPLRARVSVATGPVVIDFAENDATGAGGARAPHAVVGPVLHVAETLQALAQPGEVIAGPRTCRLAGRGFEYVLLPAQPIPALEFKLTPRRVAGRAAPKLRFESARAQAGNGGPLLGRDEELGLLVRRWRSAQQREGQVVLIGGEPGIGKSRLAWALGRTIAEDAHWRLRYQCSPYHSGTPLWPVAEHVRGAARIEDNDDDATRLAKLERLLNPTAQRLSEDLPPVAALLGVALDERYPVSAASPERQRERLLDALENLVVDLSRRRPTLLVFEDVHWADPSSLELVERVMDRALKERLLIVVTSRPEFQPPWDAYPHLTALQLARIGKDAARAMVEHCSAAQPLAPVVVQQIIEKTDGVPLFVEELTRAVVEASESGAADTSAARTALVIPDTLQDSLMARLDRLSPVKRIAQVAAALGREFSYTLLDAVANVKPDVLGDALQRLTESGLLLRRGQPPRAMYQFKHALIRDAAYDTLLRGQRQALHSRIADVLSNRFPQRVEDAPELLAYHLTECGESAQAVAWWEKAGEQAMTRHAASESRRHYERGLALLEEQSATDTRSAQELSIRMGLGSAILHASGYHTSETRTHFERAFDLSESAGAPIEQFWSLCGIFLYHYVGGDLLSAGKVCERASTLAQHIDDPAIQAAALILEADYRSIAGEPRTALAAQARALDIADTDALHALSVPFGGDPTVVALAWGALNEWLLGRLSAGIEKEQRAIALVERFGDPLSQALAAFLRVMRLCMQFETTTTLAESERLIELCSEQGYDEWLIRVRAFRGFALCRQGQLTEGLAELSQSNAVLETSGSKAGTTLPKALLAQAFALADDDDEAWRVIERTIADMKERNEYMFEPELYSVRGDLLLARTGNVQDAEASYQLALKRANERGMRSFALRPAVALATLWQERRKQREACALLESVCTHFDEDDHMPNLDAARDLLSTLQTVHAP